LTGGSDKVNYIGRGLQVATMSRVIVVFLLRIAQ